MERTGRVSAIAHSNARARLATLDRSECRACSPAPCACQSPPPRRSPREGARKRRRRRVARSARFSPTHIPSDKAKKYIPHRPRTILLVLPRRSAVKCRAAFKQTGHAACGTCGVVHAGPCASCACARTHDSRGGAAVCPCGCHGDKMMHRATTRRAMVSAAAAALPLFVASGHSALALPSPTAVDDMEARKMAREEVLKAARAKAAAAAAPAPAPPPPKED